MTHCHKTKTEQEAGAGLLVRSSSARSTDKGKPSKASAQAELQADTSCSSPTQAPPSSTKSTAANSFTGVLCDASHVPGGVRTAYATADKHPDQDTPPLGKACKRPTRQPTNSAPTTIATSNLGAGGEIMSNYSEIHGPGEEHCWVVYWKNRQLTIKKSPLDEIPKNNGKSFDVYLDFTAIEFTIRGRRGKPFTNATRINNIDVGRLFALIQIMLRVRMVCRQGDIVPLGSQVPYSASTLTSLVKLFRQYFFRDKGGEHFIETVPLGYRWRQARSFCIVWPTCFGPLDPGSKKKKARGDQLFKQGITALIERMPCG